MSRMFQAKLDIPENAALPDEWDVASTGLAPPDDFVVSRYANGVAASTLADIYWNWTPYDPDGRPRWLCFDYWQKTTSRIDRPMRQRMSGLRSRIVAETQRFMALLIYKKRGASLSFSSLTDSLSVLRLMGQYSEKHEIGFEDLWSSSALLEDFCSSLDTKTAVSKVARLMGVLMAMNPETDLGFTLGCAELFATLQKRVSDFPANRQTPPMPTRIYSSVLTALNTELSDFDVISDCYLALVARLVALRSIPRGDRKSFCDVGSMLAEHGLTEYFREKGITPTMHGVSSGLSDIQTVCRLTVQAYTGMRHSEAQMLPYHCLSAEKRPGVTHYFLGGRTTKFENGRIRRTQWVTSKEGARAVDIARRVAAAIYEVIGDTPHQADERISRYPLFVATSYLEFAGRQTYQVVTQDAYLTSDSRLASPPFAQLSKRLRPIINEGDIRELEEIDPHRAWGDDPDYGVGQAWSLRSHQFRRSLALYAQRSGLVSLPSLRRQLQHITREMSLYYSKGSVFAKNFIEDDPRDYKEHICKDWRDAKPVSEAMAFLRDIVFADEPLFGAAGIFEQQKKNRGQIVDRAITLKQFQKGLTAYKATPFGGCVKVGECDKTGLRMMGVLCLQDCKNIVIKLSKLNRAIDQQQHLVNSLEQSSITYHLEKDDLDSMIAARKRCLEIANRGSDRG
ncbi:hypothetical protein AWB79_02796 [Caballeronia hypogeia]|uniref:Integrase n=2 Tax=Caballeronia hypogeia TaxID=1777140 RepID=A0A158AUE8_9BURK|nr:hypothetical protein AWB79_02796 [Caballeronia hypogeia]